MTDIYVRPGKPSPTTCTASAASKSFGELSRRVATTRERVTITHYGRPIAVLVNPSELEELEMALAAAEHRIRQIVGDARNSHTSPESCSWS